MCAAHHDRRKRSKNRKGKGKRRHRRNLKINISIPNSSSETVVEVHVKQSKSKEKDYHHLLFFKHNWAHDNDYSQLLRNTPYMRVYIEREALHNSVIHAQMRRGIPVPPECECKRAYLALKSANIIGCRHREIYDSVFQRLDFLIKIWSGHSGCAETVQALRTQRLLFQNFYKRNGYPPRFTKINPRY